MTVSRAVLDRAASLRDEEGVLERLRSEHATRVLAVRDGRVRVDDAGLVLARPSDFADFDADWALLGRWGEQLVLLAALPPVEASIDAVADETWLDIRNVGGRLDPEQGELLVEAVALAGWLRDAPFCSRCGTRTGLRQAGWARLCPSCGAEHFPRTDPAVIVAIESPDGERILLGANANWGGRMYSCFAGFAEAGESLEATTHREIEEEAGVRLASLRYVSSQAWPYPRSLMVGFRAVVEEADAARADGTEILDVRWFTRTEIGAALDGDGPVGLPGPASIARALIVDWHQERA